MKKHLIILLSVVLIFSLCACDASIEMKTPSAPTSTQTESPNPTQTESSTTAPTQTEAPTPTETVDENEQLRAELIENRQLFLDYKGKFAKEKIKTMDCADINIKPGKSKMGLMESVDAETENIKIQGPLLGYYLMDNGDIFVEFGVEKKNGDRFTLKGEINASDYNKLQIPLFGFYEIYGVTGTNITILNEDDNTDTSKKYLNTLIGEVVTFDILIDSPFKHAPADEIKKMFTESDPELQIIQENLFQKARDNADLVIEAAYEVDSNGMSIGIKRPKNMEDVLKNDSSRLMIGGIGCEPKY